MNNIDKKSIFRSILPVTINHASGDSASVLVQSFTFSRQIVHVGLGPSIWQRGRVLDFVLYNMRFTSRIVHVSALPTVVQLFAKSINLVLGWSSTLTMAVRVQVTPATVFLNVLLTITEIDAISSQTGFRVRIILFQGSIQNGVEVISERVTSCP